MTDIKMEKVVVTSEGKRQIEGDWTVDYSEPAIEIWGFCPGCRNEAIIIAEITGEQYEYVPEFEPPIISREIDGVSYRICSACEFPLGKEEDFDIF